MPFWWHSAAWERNNHKFPIRDHLPRQARDDEQHENRNDRRIHLSAGPHACQCRYVRTVFKSH